MATQGKSRLAQMQMQYQQKQKTEIEQKRNELATRRVTPINSADNNLQIGKGKVRQMFDERRQRVAGIDKGYPLQPIQTRVTPNASAIGPRNKIRETESTPRLTNRSDMTDMNRQMENLNMIENFNSNIKLGPVVTRKTISNNISANSLNNRPKLPRNSSEIRSMPITPEKSKLSADKSRSAAKPTLKKNISASTSSSNSSSARSSGGSANSAKPERKMAPPDENSSACRICGRYFNNDRIEKHQVICEKTATKKRKIFDATKHRIGGTEAEPYLKKAAKTVNKKQIVDAATKKNNWRRKHEEFIQAIRSAKQVQQHLANGGKLSDLPPPPPSENPDYVQCPHCQRKFNESAAQRHIPKCASFQFNKPKPKPKALNYKKTF